MLPLAVISLILVSVPYDYVLILSGKENIDVDHMNQSTPG